MKNNDGISDINVPIFFDGLTEHCEQLPMWSDPQIEQYYDYARTLK